ncbi:MAG: hypothetical protein ACE5FJ_12050 [Gemmatimonadales bacterium]
MAGKRCPFCGSHETAKQSDFGTSLMVASHHCPKCNSYFEAIKWGEGEDLDVPEFMKDGIAKASGDAERRKGGRTAKDCPRRTKTA